MNIKAIKTRVFKGGEELVSFIARFIKKIPEKSVIVITSKIVSLSEKRTAVIENSRTKEKLIRKESEFALPTKYVWLTIKDGVVMPSAGIDESNADGKLVLLPKDSFESTARLRSSILHPPERTGSVRAGKARMKNLGIIITDSRITPLRRGVVGVALGYAGFRGIRDYRGAPDLFGRAMEVTETDIADSLATAATLVMGEGSESQPLAVIEGAPVEWALQVDREEMKMPRDQDMFKHLFD